MKKNGFTLVELVLYLTLVSVFLVVAIKFTQDIIIGRVKIEAYQEIRQNIVFSTFNLNKYLHQSSDVSLGSSYDINLADNPGSFFSLQTPNADSPVIFSVDNGILMMKIGAGNPINLTSSNIVVTNLTFFDRSPTDLSGKNIKYSFSVQLANNPNKGWKAQDYAEGTIELRNYTKPS